MRALERAEAGQQQRAPDRHRLGPPAARGRAARELSARRGRRLVVAPAVTSRSAW